MDLPPTQIGAIIFNILTMIFVIFCYIASFLYYFIRKIAHQKDIDDFYFITPSLFYQCWFHGYDSLTVNKTKREISLKQSRIGFCCFDTTKKKLFSKLKSFETKRCKWSLWYILWSIIVGCWVGLYLHFIPCFGVWSCDGSPNDRIQIRGAILFTSLALSMIFLFVISFIPFLRQRKLELTFLGDERKYYFLITGNNELLLNLLNDIVQENQT
eukprot:gene1877-1018_t